MPAKRVGLLVGRERTFPDALIAEVNGRSAGVECSYAEIEATRIEKPPAYDVLVDRISHDVTCYQPVLKLAALNGTRVINNPFFRIADDKFFNTALAMRLGVKVPKTVALPSKSYNPDVSTESLRNLRMVDWEKLVAELGLPIYLKPHWGGGWRDVSRATTLDELWKAYDKTGQNTMIAQEEIRWQQYVRCIVIGQDEVRPALWDPRKPHHERYTAASKDMKPLSEKLEKKVIEDAKTLCRALGYDMNTVEFAISAGVPYAIDFMNSAPDLDISSLGEEHFKWAVEKMAELVVRLALQPRVPPRYRWDAMLAG